VKEETKAKQTIDEIRGRKSKVFVQGVHEILPKTLHGNEVNQCVCMELE